MRAQVLLGLVATFAIVANPATGKFTRTGPCKAGLHGYVNVYIYTATQKNFDDENEENINLSCTVKVICVADGTYGSKKARLYDMVITDTMASGNIYDKAEQDMAEVQQAKDTDDDGDDDDDDGAPVKNFDDAMKGWFKFLQSEDGSIVAVYHSREETTDVINFKKSIAASFQANFKGTKSKVEADPQSVHKANYTYDASVQAEEGTIKMHRKVTSSDVQDYASHVAGDKISLTKDEDIEYKKGVLTHSQGVTTTKILSQDDVPPEKDVEEDSMEANVEDTRKKRDLNEYAFFDMEDEDPVLDGSDSNTATDSDDSESALSDYLREQFLPPGTQQSASHSVGGNRHIASVEDVPVDSVGRDPFNDLFGNGDQRDSDDSDLHAPAMLEGLDTSDAHRAPYGSEDAISPSEEGPSGPDDQGAAPAPALLMLDEDLHNVPAYDMSEEQTYDPSVDLDKNFEAQGSYSLKLVGQHRNVRLTRSIVDHLLLPEAMESSLLAYINHTEEDLEHMKKIRSDLGEMRNALNKIHNDPETSSAVYKVEELLKLEKKFGPQPGFTPAIDDVLNYLETLLHSKKEENVGMRIHIYFMISSEGSLRSQMALLSALNQAVNEEEREAIVMYIAFAENPHPQTVSRLEVLINSNQMLTDPLLLAYGALISKASPELQQRMVLFLLKRLPHAEGNDSSLIHLILSLGNTESPHVTSSILDYLQHPELHVQLSSIHALRYATNDTAVQKALIALLSQPGASDDHLAVVIQSLQYGIEHAKNNYQVKPYCSKLATVLCLLAINSENNELIAGVANYLENFYTQESDQLIQIMRSAKASGYKNLNSTRFARGTNWAASNSVYNLVASLSSRRADIRNYPYRKSYIWGKKFGVKKGNVQIAAGGFLGVSRRGDYKIFGRAKAVGRAFGRTKTALDVLVLRQKGRTSTRSRLYAYVIGKTLINLNIRQDSTVCKRYSKPLHRPRNYRLFSFGINIFIYVGTIRISLSAYVKLDTEMYIQFCDNRGSATAAAGLTPTITMTIRASATANILRLVRGGITVSAVFNYQLNPTLSTRFCYTNGRLRVQNCAAIYHQWKNNRITIDTWYQTRRFFLFGRWRPRKKWKKLSASWRLRDSRRKPLWRLCDRRFYCRISSSVRLPVRLPLPVRLRG